MTLVDVLRQRAADAPSDGGFTFDDDRRLTFAELDQRAAEIAGVLRKYGTEGERALLVFPTGPDFVAALFGCFYAGWVAVPVPPPGRDRRFETVLTDARPRVVLTTQRFASRVSRAGVWCVAVDALEADAALPSEVRPDDLAILQYTSGSTAAPRGVMLTHANLVDNTSHIARRFGMHRGSCGVTWLPLFHDMGLVGGVLQCVAVGFHSTLMSPLAFLRRPARWLEAISGNGATIAGGPNFAYELCLERITPEERARLDLSTWEVAFVGAEPVRRATLERFASTFAECGFRREALYPCYGLAEATLMVTGGDRLTGWRTRGESVSCGPVIDGHTLRIADPLTGSELNDGEIGEVTLEGPSVARGYWGGEAFTTLRTGDLGLVEDGQLFVMGRTKAVLIVHGQKFHAEDIERTVAESHCHGWPGGVAAVGVDTGQREELVVLQEVTSDANVERSIRVAIAAKHGLAPVKVVLLRPGELPRTSSGKIRRDRCLQ